MNISQERLKELLSYDPDTGIFKWRVHRFSVKVGDIAGSLSDSGYVIIGINHRLYRAHRLAWLYVHGYFPENGLDHINRIRNDNRIINLREVSRSCNLRNAKGNSGSFSGIKGVVPHLGVWRVFITVKGKMLWLGGFSSKYFAAKSRYEAEIKHGYITCDSYSEAKKYIDAHPATPEEESIEAAYREKVRIRAVISNTSGVTGVTWNTAMKKWIAQIQVRGKNIYLGSYDSKSDAAKARHAAEIKYKPKKFISEHEEDLI